MKPIKFLPIIIVLALALSACGAQPPAIPTMSADDVQTTAVAAAFTMVAQTQAAIPTASPLPPTDIPTSTTVPLPTNTAVGLPTIGLGVTATTGALSAPTTSSSGASGAATADPCSNRVLAGSPQGKGTTIRIVNKTSVPVKLSLYLAETASHGECGYRYYEIAKANDIVITDLVQGCYYLWAWSDAAKNKFNSSGSGCINNPDKWTFEISSGSIKFVGP